VSTIYWNIPGGSVKNLNKHAILDRIRFTPGGISRVELARQLRLTRAAVTSIVNDLEALGLVQESGSQGPSGRKPVDLEINPSSGHVLGIDIGSTHVTVVLSDASARVLREWEEPLDVTRGPQTCLDQTNRIVQTMVREHHLEMNQVGAAGVGVPGPVCKDTGRVVSAPAMPGWENYPVQEVLQDMWHIPVTLSNDAELGALGEWAYGAARGEPSLVYIKVGHGVGAGLLVDGQIYRGVGGTAGEIGHTTLYEDGPPCICGNRGCLEAIAGGRAVAQRGREGVRKGLQTRLADIQPVESITFRDVIDAARRGDLLSQRILADTGQHLGTAVANLVNLFNPGMVVIGGGISQIGDQLIEPIRQVVQRRSLRAASQTVRISGALLGRRSTSMGAVVEALSVYMHQLAGR